MEETSFLSEILLLIAFATAGVAVFEQLRLPSIAGFLVMGALMGPGGFGLIADPERVRSLAEIGVVFLLFEIGLELPLERLRRLWRKSVVGGALQVGATLACAAAIGVAVGLPWRTAVVVGALVALSSTALVMRLLSERGVLDAPQGQLSVGILLFQDLCVVPFLLAVPILAAGGSGDAAGVALGIARAAAVMLLFFGAARFLLPPLLDRVAHLRSRELFTMTGVLVVMGSAVVGQEVGLTLSVGAFIGGLVLAASPWAHQLFAEVIPMRGLFLGVFFTAVGMLFDPAEAVANAAGVAAWAVGVVVLKAGFVVAIVALALRQGLRVGVLTGLALAQTGEFSFVLAAESASAGLLDDSLQQVFISGSILTLVATPFLMMGAPRIASLVARRADRREAQEARREAGPSDHVVLVGFGLAGQTLARVLRARGVPYAAVEANATTVERARDRGEPVLYGDAARRSILERLGVPRARLVAVSIPDPLATREVIALSRSLAPDVPIVARTRYVADVDHLTEAGAGRVVAEEFESTLELLGETLRRFGVPQESIARFTAELRDEGYEFLRTPETILDPWLVELLEEVAARWVEVPASFGPERSLAGLGVRARTGATVLAVERGGATTPNPPPDFGVRPGDRLMVLGSAEAIERLDALVSGTPPADAEL